MSEASAGKRPGRGAVQARECSQSGEEREPKQGPGSFARSVSTVSTAHNAYNTFLDPLTWPLHWGSQKNRLCDASLGLFMPTELILAAFGTEGYCEMVEKVF